MTQTTILFDNVTRSYRQGSREIHALRGVSFEVYLNEFVAVRGRSGSGKSTVLNLACGIDDPTSGEVRVAGKSIGTMTEREKTALRRTRVGMVFQFFNLIPTLNVLENALLPAYLASQYSSKKRERAKTLLERIGLADRAYAYPETLSGGEQQRLAIVRAVINDPQIILADEPTGNLDTENAHDIMDSLQQFSRMEGKTVLMVTHSSDALRYTDRVLNIADGLLVE